MKFNGMMDGKICIEGDVNLVSTDYAMTQISSDRESEYFIRKTNIEGIYTYGIKSLVEDRIWDKPVGYIWASRASVMNKVFDTCLIECYYRKENTQTYTCCSIDLVRYEDFLKSNGYKVNFVPYENTDSDVSFKVEKMEK